MRKHSTTLNESPMATSGASSRRQHFQSRRQSARPQAPTAPNSPFLAASKLADAIESRLIDLKCGNNSKRTVEKNKTFLRLFTWYIERDGFKFCDREAIKGFFL